MEFLIFIHLLLRLNDNGCSNMFDFDTTWNFLANMNVSEVILECNLKVSEKKLLFDCNTLKQDYK